MSSAPRPPRSPRLARSSSSSRRGAAAVGAMMLAISVGGLSLGLLLQGAGVSRSVTRTEDGLRALEAAETSLALAELEIASGQDPGGDGLGTLSGTSGGASYSCVATPDALIPDRFSLAAVGKKGLAVREVEVGLRRISGGAFIEGLFSHKDLVLNGVNSTDSYDSMLGTYASQAVNTDATGPYALAGGNIGSNSGFIELHGSSIVVRGNAIPGPGRSVEESGHPLVWGDTTPRKYERDVQPIPLSTFQGALAANNNGAWTAVGGNLTYSAATSSLSYKAGGVLTFPAGTYFFSSFTLSGNSTVRFTGPSKVYVTGSMDLTGGTLLNTGAPADLQVFGHPYALPAGFAPTTTDVKVNGGTGSAMVFYGPSASFTIGGNSEFFGAAVAEQVTITGGTRFHYDKALDRLGLTTVARVQRLYWRDAAPPRR